MTYVQGTCTVGNWILEHLSLFMTSTMSTKLSHHHLYWCEQSNFQFYDRVIKLLYCSI